MTKQIIDAKGEICPKPLILTKKALQGIQQGDSFIIIVDNATAKDNILKFLQDNGDYGIYNQAGETYEITVTKQTTGNPMIAAEDYCAPVTISPRGNHIIVIKNDKMGHGSDELGAILIQAFINTIKETSPLPDKIIFYNAGIKLAVDGSPVIPALNDLETMGVEIMSCGTCLDYYKQKDFLKAGKVSNMYAILESLTKAGHIIEP